MTDESAIEFTAHSEEDVQALARAAAGIVQPPLVLHLEGPLGAGKTVFARAFVHALGHEGRVKSPTYALLEQYPACFASGPGQVLHVDLYRLADPEELEYVGLVDLLDDHTVLLVEWPEKGGAFVPPPGLVVRLHDDPAEAAPERRIVILETADSSLRERLSEVLSTVF